MRAPNPATIAVTMALVILVFGSGISRVSATEGARQIVDRDGVLHLTNVPADPRYRGLTAATGTTGWLRLPARAVPQYAAEIQEIARAHGVSPGLITAVMRTESGFDPAAVSPKGAGGLMQLMPGTAATLGVVDRFNPRENIRGGVRHLRYLLDRYQGSVGMALAAYNAGEGAVDTYRGIPPYPETQQFVRRVLQEAGLSETSTLTHSDVPPVRSRGKDRHR